MEENAVVFGGECRGFWRRMQRFLEENTEGKRRV